MNTFHDFSDLGELLRVLPARLRLVADYLAREDALEREAAAELLDECAARLEIRRRGGNPPTHSADGAGSSPPRGRRATPALPTLPDDCAFDPQTGFPPAMRR